MRRLLMLGAKLLSRISIGREIIGYLVVMDRGSAGDAEFAVHRLRIMLRESLAPRPHA